MQQIDLDDLPPKVARVIEDLSAGEEITLIRSGFVLARLRVLEATAPTSAPTLDTDMADVMEHFGAIIEDEF